MSNDRMLVDFHSHILHGIDDGSRSVDESLKMISSSAETGVGHIVLTPHFYARNNDPVHFIKKREQRYGELAEALPKDSPQLYLGAEVAYFDGMVQVDELTELRIRGSKCILVEMPFAKWSDRMLSDVYDLNRKKNFRVVLAHIERYEPCVSKRDLMTLVKDGVILQSNAESFKGFFRRRKALNMFQSGLIHVLGTDSHNLTNRSPNMDIAISVIEDRCGDGVISDIFDFSLKLLRDNVREKVGV